MLELETVGFSVFGAETRVERLVETHELQVFLTGQMIILDSMESVETENGRIEKLSR